MNLTHAQLLILRSHCPDALDGDTFIQGDDNDLACVISRIASGIRANGNLRLAFEIDSAAPEGFFVATWEQYVASFLPPAPAAAPLPETPGPRSPRSAQR